MRMPAGLRITENIGRASIGQRITLAVRTTDCEVIVWVDVFGAEQFDLRIDNVFGLCKCRVMQTRDMSRTRADVVYVVAAQAHHAATGDADHAHIQRIDVGVVAPDARMFDCRPAVAYHANVGAGSAYFEINAVRYTQVHQRAGDTGRRPR